MAGRNFPAAAKQVKAVLNELHDYNWTGTWKGNEAAFRKRIAAAAGTWDRTVGAKGKIASTARALTRPLRKNGDDLYQFLADFLYLTNAIQAHRTRRYRDAARVCGLLAESLTIHLFATTVGMGPVNERRERNVPWDAYTTRLADILGSKGIRWAGDFKRLLNVLHYVGAEWGASGVGAQLASRASITLAAFTLADFVRIKKELGTFAALPYGRYEVLAAALTAGV